MTSILDPSHPQFIAAYLSDIDAGYLVDAGGNYPLANSGIAIVSGEFGDVFGFSGAQYASGPVPPLPAVVTVSTWAVFSANEDMTLFGFGADGANTGAVNNLYYFQEGKLGVNSWNGDCYGAAWSPVLGQSYHMVLELHFGASNYHSSKLWINTSPQTMGQIRNSFASGVVADVFSIGRPGTFGMQQYFKGQQGFTRLYAGTLTDNDRTELFQEPLPYMISGMVTKDGLPIETDVRIYSVATGELLYTLSTNANGQYQQVSTTNNPVYVMPVEPGGYRPLVHGPVTPSPRNP